jgi:FecR protein
MTMPALSQATSLLNLRATALLLACAAAYPVAAQTAAGLAQYTSGQVSVSKGTGPATPLSKGDAIQAGDTITTGEQGRAQMRFSDGGFIALHGNSKFSVNGYVDAKDGGKDQFLVSLVTGGMRAITGLIGKRNPANYKVTTPTAVIGIRGSGFNVVHNANGTLSVTTELDAIDVCNTGGCIGLNVGESALVRNAQDKPVRTNIPATVAATSVTRQPAEVGNEANKDGVPSLVANALPQQVAAAPITPIITFGVSGVESNNAAYQRNNPSGTVTLDERGNPVAFVEEILRGAGENTGVVDNIKTAGSVATKDQLILGTWSKGVWTDNPNRANGVSTGLSPVAFFTGQSTSSSDLASLFGRTASYRFDQATPVLSSTGATGTLSGGNLTANFSGANTTVGVNLNVQFPGTGEGKVTNYAMSGNVSGVSTGFAGGLNISGGECSASTSKCGAIVSGSFIGPNATRAGLTFAANNTNYGTFVGAAGFTQTSLSSAAQQPHAGPTLSGK